MSDPAKLHKTIETEIKPQVAKHLKEFKDLSAALDQLNSKIPPAMGSGDARSVRLYLKALTVEEGRIEGLLTQTKELLGQLDELETDDSVADDLTEVETISKALDKLKTDLTNYLATVKKLEEAATEFLDKQKGGDKETLEKWADLEVWAKKQLETLTKYHGEMPKLLTAASDALAERDDAALQAALKDSLFYRMQAPNIAREVADKFEKFDPEIAALTDKGLKDKLTKDRKELDEGCWEQQIKIIEIFVKSKDFKIAAIDSKKAAAALKITLTAAIETKLKKALDVKVSLMEKALDALAKELHLKTTGKAMIAALKQAHLL